FGPGGRLRSSGLAGSFGRPFVLKISDVTEMYPGSSELEQFAAMLSQPQGNMEVAVFVLQPQAGAKAHGEIGFLTALQCSIGKSVIAEYVEHRLPRQHKTQFRCGNMILIDV